ncbi:Nif3-like dinuclear metal center hexameric protein [Flavobacterium sp. xlx-214]|uniref:Nif3-like dinuclear metal center hexameric protein n=1 Tax=unclassified Flavobacterium TaxID=196869 RepID=UPI0013D6B227|nr:Nif3-like dinuclear metal center hexameric protein [Flavobacterium sp. xlx-214]MBA5793747.1 Nif3-like dinuclear metal center hexameric protein [Flavobacterium sp. xlx-221]QMI83232.1 Nif3-like dinuclear metal center hexameric protein [Flavobacterium sp. xlx-214]
MQLKQIISILEEMAPTAYAEDFDNVGLLVGDVNKPITGILVCHDALEDVVTEAIEKKCNLIVCFHPILFSGIKKITGKNYVERAVIKAIKNDIAIYAVHTGLDNHKLGVNKILCDTLGLINTKILIPKGNFIYKLTTFIPKNDFSKVQKAVFAAGAGSIGNYYDCSFQSNGIGSFAGNDESNPVIGSQNVYTEVEETKLEVTFEKHLQSSILKALFNAHPYEEVAYEITKLENQHQNIGLGMIGELETEVSELDFLHFVKDKVQTGGIRHSDFLNKKVKKVAVLGGSGSFAINAAKANGADVLITADLKYHDFFQAENQILLADVGHFESERYVKNYIFDFLTKKIPTFAIILSDKKTNPVNYL